MHQHSPRLKVLLAFAAGAATALFAGGYMLYGPEGRRRRDELERWLNETKTEVLARMEHVKDMSRNAYSGIVDEVLESYALAQNLTKVQARLLTARLKSRYEEMKKVARDATETAKREIDESDGKSRMPDIQAEDERSSSGKMLLAISALTVLGAYLLRRKKARDEKY